MKGNDPLDFQNASWDARALHLVSVFRNKKRGCQATSKVSLTAKRQILLDHLSIPFHLNSFCVWLELVKLAKALLFFPQREMNDVSKPSVTLAIKYTTNTARRSKWHQSGTASLTTMSLILCPTAQFSWKFDALSGICRSRGSNPL